MNNIYKDKYRESVRDRTKSKVTQKSGPNHCTVEFEWNRQNGNSNLRDLGVGAAPFLDLERQPIRSTIRPSDLGK